MAASTGVGRGGKRRKAGRPKGAVNKRSQEVAAKAFKTGITPLEYMLEVMRSSKAEPTRRDDMAKAAAPFMHPRLNAVEHTGAKGGAIQLNVTSEDAGVL